MKALVTGAAGFIGSHLVHRLVAEGADVTIALRGSSDPRRLRDVMPRVRAVALDLEDAESARRGVAAAEPTVVFHLAAWASGRDAARDPEAWTRSFRTNALGTLHLLDAVAGRERPARFLRAGGMEEYGDGPVPFVETQRERAVSPYSASQIAATQASHAFGAARGVPVTTLRPSLVYGPGQDASFFLPGCIRAAVEDRDFEMTEGTQAVDFVYVDDVVEAFLRAADRPEAAGGIFNVGSGTAHRIRDVAEAVYRHSGSRGRLRIGARPGRPGEAPRRVLDVDKARQVLGFAAQVSLDDGIHRCIEQARRDHR